MAALPNSGMELEARIAAVQQLALFAIQLIDDQHIAAGNRSPLDTFAEFFNGFDPATTGATGAHLQIELRQKEILQAQLCKAQELRSVRQAMQER